MNSSAWIFNSVASAVTSGRAWGRRVTARMPLTQRLLHVSLAIWMVLGSAVVGADPIGEFQSANQLYDAGQFEQAIAQYESVSPKTAHVYFNLGNAHFRSGQMGRAILNYERAHRLAPRDPDIQANLKFARQRLNATSTPNALPVMHRFLSSVSYSQTLTVWSWFEVLTIWLLVITLALWFWLKRNRALLMVASLTFAFLWATCAVALAYRVSQHRHAPDAIVVAQSVDARFAPLPEATKHFTLREGDRATVREDRGAWLLIERADGQQGWVAKDSIEPVAVP